MSKKKRRTTDFVCDCPRGRRPLRAPSIACRRHFRREGTPSSATDSRPFLGSQLPSTSHRILRSNQQQCYLSLLDVAQYPLIDFTGNRAAHNWRRFFFHRLTTFQPTFLAWHEGPIFWKKEKKMRQVEAAITTGNQQKWQQRQSIHPGSVVCRLLLRAVPVCFLRWNSGRENLY